MSFKRRISRLEQKMGTGEAGMYVVGVPCSLTEKPEEEQQRFLEEAYPELKGFKGKMVQVLHFSENPADESWKFLKHHQVS